MPLNEIDVMWKAERLLNEALAIELKAQGHYLTGALEASIVGRVTKSINEVSLTGVALGYAEKLQKGVSADEMPQPGSGAYEKHIEALTKYFILRGLSEKMAAFAAKKTAKRHSEEGMPTSGSYAYSQNGDRKHFLDNTDEQAGPIVSRVILAGFDQIIDNKFHETKSETI